MGIKAGMLSKHGKVTTDTPQEWKEGITEHIPGLNAKRLDELADLLKKFKEEKDTAKKEFIEANSAPKKPKLEETTTGDGEEEGEKKKKKKKKKVKEEASEEANEADVSLNVTIESAASD